MVAEHCSVRGMSRVMALLLVMVGSSMVVDLHEKVECYGKRALQAVYFKAKTEFEVEMKPGYHGLDYAMVSHYVMDELNSYDGTDPQTCQVDNGPMDSNEPNDKEMDCKAVNLQAMDGDYSEVKYVNVMNFGNYVNDEYINRTMSLVRYDIGVIGFCGSSRTLAVMNKVRNEELQEELTAKVRYTNYIDYVVSFVKEIMGYLDFVVHQLFIKGKTMCFAVLWLLQPHRSYCIATAGLVLQVASCLDGVAEGRIFQFTMFSMMVVCGMILMAVYMRRHVAKKEHVSRISKKRRRFRTNEMKKQLLVMMFIFNYSSASAMEAEAMAQRLAALTEAATRAAMSAEQMMTKMQSMSGGSSGASEGLSAVSRILKPPDTFNGDDPMAFASWRFQFTSWLTFGDSRYTTLLERVEALTAPPAISTYDDGQKELAHKLYAVLTSYLRGRCSHIIKAFAKSRDGFAIWFQLMKEFEPTSRQRSLALAQALASYPVFSKDKSCLESVLVYEQTVQQFEESSSTTYPDELKVATLMRCCNSKLREFLQLNIKDSSTYVEVREHIMNYERVSKSWTQEQVLKAIQQEPGRPDSGGPAPMEIDRIEHKGKGKSKNKGKEQKGGRGNGWDSMAWGFGRGRGKGNSKGKGKKGKGRGKGKGKNKGKKGQGKTKAGPNQCSICFGYGHWSRECPRRMEVNQVQQATFGPCQQQVGPAQPQQYVPYPGQAFQPPGPPGHQLPATGSTAAASSSRPPPSSSTGSTVRRIFHIGPPTPSSSPSSSMYRDGSVRMVQLEEVSEEEYINLATQEEGDEEWVILDSGSDVSLLPNRFLADEGSDRSHALRDCQGGALAVVGTRSTDLQVQDVSGESVVLRHQFVVGEVTTSLISLGQLYQLGWRITEAQGTDKLCLVDPERAVEIPVHFRGKSFALKAHVRCVTEEPEEEYEVRAVVNAYEEINEEATGRWSTTTTGTPFVKLIGSYYVDPRPLWGDRWPYRTTAIRRKDSADPQWLLVELSQKFMEKSTPFGRIEEISTEFGEAACEILTVLSAEEHGVEELGEDPESGFFDVSAEREEWQPAGRELQPGQGVLSQPVQVAPQEGSQGSGDGPQGVPPGLEPDLDLEAVQPPVSPEAVAMPAVGSQPSSVTLYDGFTLTRESTIRDLKTGCRWVGVSQSGSKVRMFDRIVQAHLQALKRSEAEVAMELYNSEQKDPSLAEVPRQPSVRERELHETTHIPYRAWCPHCVATRARGDYHAGVADPGDSALREHPTVQADFFYCEERKEDAKYILLMVDTWTRYVHAEPLKVRNRKSVGEAMARFLGNLGYTENVEVAVDNEPVLVAGMECCRDIRLRLGLSTTITTNKHYDKARTSVAERMVQTVRNLQKTLILQLEESIGCRLPGGHCLRYWGIVHAAWLYSRYHVHSFLKVTPYQAVTGRPYRGKLANFGQTVLGLDPKVGKYRPGWKRGIYLGKDAAGHDVIGTGPEEVTRTKSLRRTSNLWSSEDALALKIGPWDTTGYTYSQAKPLPLPPVLPQLVDVDAAAVAAYKGDSSEEEEKDKEKENRVGKALPGLGSGGDIPGVPQHPELPPDDTTLEQLRPSTSTTTNPGGASSGSAMDVNLPKRPEEFEDSDRAKMPRLEEIPITEPPSKLPRTEVRMVHNVEATLTEEIGLEEEWELFPDFLEEDDLVKSRGEGEGPPEVSQEHLDQLDAEAALEEIKKLHDLSVIMPVSPDPSTIPFESLVDTTLVKDWRYRNGQWRRRCRIVAREYRSGQTTEEHYSPTSTFSSVRLLLVLSMLFGLAITALDVKDAFLLVDQKEYMLVIIPQWIQHLLGDGATHWQLLKCLPGQRNAALRWNEYFTELCTTVGFEPYQGCPTIMRLIDGTRRIYLSVHVDDILLICKPADVEWFTQTAGKKLTMKVDGPHPQGEGGVLYYLKKKITLLQEGVLIQPNGTYIPKLISLLKISGRRKKGLPYHSTLESYNADLETEGEKLTGEAANLFRSALGLILYIAQDRPDVQFSTKVLATYMAHPCMKALAALKHLASYLEGCSDLGILLRRCDAYDSTFDRWSEEEIVEPDYRRDRSILTLDAFSDSSWGDERSTRRSTTSGMVFANGCLILSICRAQATIALSSCEAELYAANSTMVECIYLHQLAQFLMGSDLDVRQRLFLDSSSAKFVVQRSGVGKLKHVEIKHMFLQQLLRQGIFTIHKIPTRVNPADLNTKKLSVERRKLLSNLCGLYPICAQSDRDEEVLMTRRIQRNMAHKLVQALQVVSMSLLQGCSPNLSGKELQGEQGLRGGRALHAPVQGSGNGYNNGWYVFYKEYKVYILVFVLVILMVVATTCTMYPGRRLGPRRGGQREEGGASSSSRPTGGDQGGDDPTRRSRTASRDRREDPSEEAVATLHRRLALMFMTVLEGSYTPRERVTPYGINQTLKHLLGAAKSLDDGFYFAVKDALDYLDGPEERKAVKLLGDMVKRVERTHGPLPAENGDMSKMLLQRYREVLRGAGYPVLRLEEMVFGPDDNWESESSYTVEQSFRADASRSHDSSPDRETGSQRLRRYQQSTIAEVSDPEYWLSLGHFESSSTEEWTHREALQADNGDGEEGQREEGPRGEGGEEETLAEPTPEGEALSEHGGGRFNVFEPEGEPSEHGRGVRHPLREGLQDVQMFGDEDRDGGCQQRL